MSAPTNNPASPALLFVPDISGYTRFVQSTEIEHSRHIIEELLGKIIEANETELQVSEIEGDAILFYRFGPPPSAEEFLHQVQKMFLAFHGHLRLYETQRICQCGACCSANDLTLKIVAHFGPITESHVKEHLKLFGQDVIIAHRLLKNDIDHHEYALFTQALENEWSPSITPSWTGREEGSQESDVGRINYGYVPLAPLRPTVPEPQTEDFSIPGMSRHVFSCEHEIHAPMNFVFQVAIDLPARLQWMEGAKEVELLNDHLNRLGTQHRCLVDKTSPVVVTSGITRAENTISLSETDQKRTMCSVYEFRQKDREKTLVRIDGFIKDSLIIKILFTLLLKKKLSNWFHASGRNLKHYCEELYRAQKK